MKHLPFVFNHNAGTLTVFAKDMRAAKKKARAICGDYHHVPAFIATAQAQEAHV